MTEQVIYCPRCDRTYPDEETASKHVDEAHPDQLNPFREYRYTHPST